MSVVSYVNIGGRFKKEIQADGHSFLLLIRDEGGMPDMQFTMWVDAVVFVFSLENEDSFKALYAYYAKMNQFRNTAEVPLILVGTQDAISESRPRQIDDARARKLASDLGKRCAYYETCATYGLNVERVFQDGVCYHLAYIQLVAHFYFYFYLQLVYECLKRVWLGLVQPHLSIRLQCCLPVDLRGLARWPM